MRFPLAAAAAAMILLTVSPCWAQDDVMTLTSPESARRPPVSFPHAQHADTVDCAVCHHDFDRFGNNTGSEGRACNECHGSQGNPEALSRAFHRLCAGCHAKKEIREEYNPPVMCGQCHLKTK
ncbi:MAG: cytochrome c3 family protein [Thermodesulfobacteriota bacterium]